jgi:hypothetical protein
MGRGNVLTFQGEVQRVRNVGGIKEGQSIDVYVKRGYVERLSPTKNVPNPSKDIWIETGEDKIYAQSISGSHTLFRRSNKRISVLLGALDMIQPYVRV